MDFSWGERVKECNTLVDVQAIAKDAKPDDEGLTIGHYLVMYGKPVEFMQALDVKGIAVAKDNAGVTPVHTAASTGQLAYFNLFIQEGGDILMAAGASKQTCLMMASSKGKISIVQRILDIDPNNANITDLYGRCALHLAAANGHEDVGMLLAEHTTFPVVAEDGSTPLHIAAELNLTDLVLFLAEKCSNMIFMKDCDGKTSADLMSEAVHGKLAEAIKSGRIPKPTDD